MKTKTIKGQLVSVDKTAVHEFFVGQGVISAMVKTDAGEVNVRFIPTHGFTLGYAYGWMTGAALLAIDAEAKHDTRKYVSAPLDLVVPNKEYFCNSVRIRPAIGDEVLIYWDYGQCFSTITKLAHDRSELCDWEYPVEQSRAFDPETIIDSYIPKSQTNNE